MEKVRNFTPHEIVIIGENGKAARYPSEGVARVQVENRDVGAFAGVQLVRSEFGEVEGLPPVKSHTLVIVSRIVRDACPDRGDLVVPTDFVRDKEGRIVGAQALEVR